MIEPLLDLFTILFPVFFLLFLPMKQQRFSENICNKIMRSDSSALLFDSHDTNNNHANASKALERCKRKLMRLRDEMCARETNDQDEFPGLLKIWARYFVATQRGRKSSHLAVMFS